MGEQNGAARWWKTPQARAMAITAATIIALSMIFGSVGGARASYTCGNYCGGGGGGGGCPGTPEITSQNSSLSDGGYKGAWVYWTWSAPAGSDPVPGFSWYEGSTQESTPPIETSGSTSHVYLSGLSYDTTYTYSAAISNCDGSTSVSGSIATSAVSIASSRSFYSSEVGFTGSPSCYAPLNMTVTAAALVDVEKKNFWGIPISSFTGPWGQDGASCSYTVVATVNTPVGPGSNATGTYYEISWAISASVNNGAGGQSETYTFSIDIEVFTNGDVFYQISGSGQWNNNWIMQIVGWAEEIGEGLLHIL